MSKFKVGDKIKAIRGSANGKIYIVARIYEDGKWLELKNYEYYGLEPSEDYVLVTEMKENSTESGLEMSKFKVGDIVRSLNTGLKHEVSKVLNDHAFYLYGDHYVTNSNCYELVSDKSELQSLIDKHHAGIEAFNKICKEHPGKVRFKDSLSPLSPFWTRRIRTLEIIPEKPKFELFFVGPDTRKHKRSPAWKVELQGDHLHIGCKDFDVNDIKNALRSLTQIGGIWHAKEGYLRATKRGILAQFEDTHDTSAEITWEEADQILKALEKAGV